MVMTKTEYQFGELESKQSFNKCFAYTFGPLTSGLLTVEKIICIAIPHVMRNHHVDKNREVAPEVHYCSTDSPASSSQSGPS